MKLRPDAFGAALWDGVRGEGGEHVMERDDGRVDVMDASLYLAPYAKWSAIERQAIRLARGRVLDIGCGAGRHTLYLQSRGHDVLAIDESPLAIRAARKLGVRRAKVMDIRDVGPSIGTFDTILMLGNNFGLFGSRARARSLLRKFRGITTPPARVLAASNDIYKTRDPAHLSYQRRNRRRGRMSGQIRLRVRYEDRATPWFDYLMVSANEMLELIDGTGWSIVRTLRSKGSGYVAVLEKISAASRSP